MPNTMEEFVNPKSMITPGVLASFVSMAAGAAFTMLGVPIPTTLIILSFFTCLIVFFSKEFSEPEITKKAKGFFYVLNSIIIFSMATGTHVVLDRRNLPATAGFSLIQPVNAQGEQETVPPLKQKRPFFYDWTKGNPVPGTDPEHTEIVDTKIKENFGKVKGFLVLMGLATPNYMVQVKIDESKIPGDVKSVTWNLSKEYFEKDQVTTTDKSGGFEINIQAWKPFAIGAEIELESGEKVVWADVINFDAVEK